jgi:hypothetical protein
VALLVKNYEIVATHRYSTRERRKLKKRVEDRTEERSKTAATRGHLASKSKRKALRIGKQRLSMC